MVNFELVFGNTYHTEPRCKNKPCEEAAQTKAVLCGARERGCPVTENKEKINPIG